MSDRFRRSFSADLKRKILKKHKRRRTRSPKGNAEEKYITLRAGFSPKKWIDEVFDMQLTTHLKDEYVKQPEFNALLNLTGKIETAKANIKWTATRADMQKYFALSEKNRWHKKFKLTRSEAAARFATGKHPKKVEFKRPTSFEAKPTSQYYPKPNSSEGKIKTKIIGAKRVDKDFAEMIKALFSIGKGLDKLNKVKVGSRSYTKR